MGSTNAIYKTNIEISIHDIKGLIAQLSSKEKASILKECFNQSDWPAKWFDLVKMEIQKEGLSLNKFVKTKHHQGIGDGLHIAENIINKYAMEFSLEEKEK